MRSKEWQDFWTGKLKRIHYNPKNLAKADGGSMGFHHSSDIKHVTCKTCRRLNLESK